ncbi:MAG: helix-turn-helix domain-containing protein [Candidatus Limisoma sp.]
MQEIKEIPRVSLDKIISIFHKEEGDAYTPGCLLASRTRQQAIAANEKYGMPMEHPFSLNAFIFLLCESGSFRVLTNSEEYTVNTNGLFINFPGQIMRADSTDVSDCKVRMMVVDLDFIKNLNLDIKPIIQKLLAIKNKQCFDLGEKTFAEVCNLWCAVADEINNNEHDETSDEIMRNLVSAFFFKVCRVVNRTTVGVGSTEEFDKNAGYFKEFMMLLGEYYKTERSVKFYAEKMRLSPKYFTTIIKRSSGSTVAQWINHFVVLEAKNLLKYSTMNVQEIAYSLNFPNQSFFGKYFKHHTGMTPSEYKKSK